MWVEAIILKLYYPGLSLLFEKMNVDPVNKYRDVFHLWFGESGKSGLLQAEVEFT